jgi:hypothetical protein
VSESLAIKWNYLIAYLKLNSKWIIDLNLRAKPIKFLEENTEVNYYLGLDNNFLDIIPTV